MGRRLAASLGIGVDDTFSLLAPTSGEWPDEAVFTVRGLYDSGVPGYDANHDPDAAGEGAELHADRGAGERDHGAAA